MILGLLGTRGTLDAILDEINRVVGLIGANGQFASLLNQSIQNYNNMFNGVDLPNMSELEYSQNQEQNLAKVKDQMKQMGLNYTAGQGATVSGNFIDNTA